MRYQDWDVLLFPQASPTPIQEFRTACFSVQEGQVQTPTLVTYIPSLAKGAPFSISIHSWTKPAFSIGAAPLTPGGVETVAWAIRVISDGVCVASSSFTANTTWPQTIVTDAQAKTKPLAFPPFHRSVLSRREWNISDDLGRIKVVISEGYRRTLGERTQFQPVRNVACFSFHPAPLEYLERCNIAWPNPSIRLRPINTCGTQIKQTIESTSLSSPSRSRPSTQHRPSTLTGVPDALAEKKTARFTSNPFWIEDLPSIMHPCPDMQSLSSRSSSGTTMNSSQLETIYEPFSDHTVEPLRLQKSTTVRLPSDQIRQIISALSLGTQLLQDKELTAPTAQMVAPKAQDTPLLPTLPCKSATGGHGRDASDADMHTTCSHFPHCTVENPQGTGLLHCSPNRLSARPGTVRPIEIHKDTSEPDKLDEKDCARDESRGRKAKSALGASLSSTKASGKKRTRCVLAALEPNGVNISEGSPKRKFGRKTGAKVLDVCSVDHMAVTDENGEEMVVVPTVEAATVG